MRQIIDYLNGTWGRLATLALGLALIAVGLGWFGAIGIVLAAVGLILIGLATSGHRTLVLLAGPRPGLP
jgi:hypothetical protein